MEISEFWRSANLRALARAPIEVDGRLYWSGQYAEWLMRAAPLTHVAIYPTYSSEIRLISKWGGNRSPRQRKHPLSLAPYRSEQPIVRTIAP